MMIDWCYSWCMCQHFAPLLNVDCVYQLTPTPQCAMTNHLCVFVLCEYPCDMDHVFHPKWYILCINILSLQLLLWFLVVFLLSWNSEAARNFVREGPRQKRMVLVAAIISEQFFPETFHLRLQVGRWLLQTPCASPLLSRHVLVGLSSGA